MKFPTSLNPFKAAAGSPWLIRMSIRFFLANAWFIAGITAFMILMVPVYYLTTTEEERAAYDSEAQALQSTHKPEPPAENPAVQAQVDQVESASQATIRCATARSRGSDSA